MLSGYPSTLYEDLLTGWRILELQVKKPVHINIDQTPVSGKLAEIKPVSIYQVRRTEKEILYNSLIEQFHYLNYCQPVGEHLKYIVLANDRPIACFHVLLLSDILGVGINTLAGMQMSADQISI
jgi:hypothetical protein